MCSMAATDPQFQWLNATLRAVDRTRTPWLIVQVCVCVYSYRDTEREREGEKYQRTKL